MTEKQLPRPKYYYGMDGNISDGENVYRTKCMPKEDLDEVFYDEKQLGSNSLMDLLNALHEENGQLKQRNNRQAKQLDRLYNLIEEKDWRTLTDIIDDFKRCEEQLQKEWGTYGDFE